MSALRVLTADTIRAEQLSAYATQDWRETPGLQAGWSVSFGPVTRVLFLQSVSEAGEPPPMPTSTGSPKPEARERQWLREVNPHRPGADDVRLYELRTYDARAGQGAEFLELMLGALPVREKYSRNCGIWESLSGRHEQVLHLWGYRNLGERDAVRAGLKGDPDWQRYTTAILPLLQTLQSTILSPLQQC